MPVAPAGGALPASVSAPEHTVCAGPADADNGVCVCVTLLDAEHVPLVKVHVNRGLPDSPVTVEVGDVGVVMSPKPLRGAVAREPAAPLVAPLPLTPFSSRGP